MRLRGRYPPSVFPQYPLGDWQGGILQRFGHSKRGVREIKRDKAPIKEMKIEGDGNDVLQFHRGDGKALLLVQWDFYRPRAGVYAEYEIDYDTSDLTVEMQDDLIV